jgi:hypothetical protein
MEIVSRFQQRRTVNLMQRISKNAVYAINDSPVRGKSPVVQGGEYNPAEVSGLQSYMPWIISATHSA